MYLCGHELRCLEPLVFQQLQMRALDSVPVQMLRHSCACCTGLMESSCDEASSFVELRWALLKYFYPLEQDSESLSQGNIFWTTAEALFGSEQHTGGLDKQRATPIIAEATRQMFSLAAWPCPDDLSGSADLLIEQSAAHPDAPMGFAIMTPQDRLKVLKMTRFFARGDGHALPIARWLAAACALDQAADASAGKPSRTAGSVSAACSDDMLTEYQRSVFLQFALLPLNCPSKVQSILEAAATGALFVQQLFLDETCHVQQGSIQLTMTDIRAIDTLAHIHARTSILVNWRQVLVAPLYLPSGVSLQRLAEVGPEQLDALSMSMHVEDHQPPPATATSHSSPPATTTDQCPPPANAADATPGSCSSSSNSSSRQCLSSDARSASGHEPDAKNAPVGSGFEHNLEGRAAADDAQSASAAKEQPSEASGNTSHAESESRTASASVASGNAAARQDCQQLLNDVSIGRLIKVASVKPRLRPKSARSKQKQVAGSNRAKESRHAASANAAPSAVFAYRLTKPWLHEFVERQFAIAALVATLQGQHVQIQSRKDSDGSSVFTFAVDGVACAAEADIPHVPADNAGNGGWHMAEGWRSEGFKSIAGECIARVFCKLPKGNQHVFYDKMSKLADSLADQEQQSQKQMSLESSSLALQAAKDKRAKKQAKANKQAGSVQSVPDRNAAINAESAAANLLLEEETEHQAGLERARKAAAKRAKAQRKKSSSGKPGLKTAEPEITDGMQPSGMLPKSESTSACLAASPLQTKLLGTRCCVQRHGCLYSGMAA